MHLGASWNVYTGDSTAVCRWMVGSAVLEHKRHSFVHMHIGLWYIYIHTLCVIVCLSVCLFGLISDLSLFMCVRE